MSADSKKGRRPAAAGSATAAGARSYDRSLIEASLDPLVTISSDGTITDVNEATIQVTGRSRYELIGTDFSMYFTDPAKAEAGYRAAFRSGQVRDCELELRHRDGAITPVIYNAAVFRDEQGEVAGVFAAARDITERRRAEEERTQLAAIVDSSDDAIIGKSLDGTIVSWNPGAERLYGYTAAEMLGRHISFLALPGQREEVAGMLGQIRRGASVRHYETVRVRRDGTSIHVSLTLSPIRDRHGKIVGASTIARDITERKRSEETVRRVSAYNRRLIEASLDPLVTINPDGTIADVNEATVQVTGRSRAELIGTDFSTYFTDPEKAKAGYEAAFNAGSVRDYALELRDPNGAITSVLYNATVYRDESGAIAGVFAAARDVTERRRAEDALLAAYNELDDRVKEQTADLVEANRKLEMKSRKLEQSNEELQRFAYVASHDLQEPLRSIVSFSQLLERRYKGKLGQDADEFIGFIVEGGVRMQRLIQDLLTLSRVDTMGGQPTPTDPGEVVEAGRRALETALAEAGATLEVGTLPAVVADPRQLEQVFANLFSNAIKYRHPDRPPEIRISSTESDGMVEFSVADNGIGIEPEYYDRIFEMFRRLHTHDRYEGTGIGLAVVKRIVDRHGGRVWVESVPGEGSTFVFTLPAA